MLIEYIIHYKMLSRTLSLIIILIAASPGTLPGQLTEWRGPGRNGIYNEQGLMKKWPESGPAMLWSYEGLGAGHGNAGFSSDKIFLLGMPDTTGILYAFSFDGKLLWKREYGPEWIENYTGPRSTPIVIDDNVYFESGRGIVYCYDANTGAMKWSVDLFKKFGARKTTWGMAESLLIAGETLYCTPGGPDHNIVALNRLTGQTIWTSTGNRQQAAYCSPVLVKHKGTTLLVTMTSESIVGIDALTGEFYWQVPQFQGNKIHANTPVYSNGIIYCASENAKTDCGLVALKLSDDGKSASVLWRNENFKNLMGGIIVKEGYIYGSMYRKNLWSCINTTDGSIAYSSDRLGDGCIIMADGLFYCYSEKGEMALVSADKSSFSVISKFQVTKGTDQHWSHPVIFRGILYIRHGNAFMAYKIR